jgi:hypothetical protein
MSSWLRRIADTLTLSQITSATGIRIPRGGSPIPRGTEGFGGIHGSG